MQFAQHTDQVFLRYVCVPSSRNYRGVAKEFLHRAYVNPVLQEQGSYGMSEHVRSNVRLDTGLLPAASDHVRDPLR